MNTDSDWSSDKDTGGPVHLIIIMDGDAVNWISKLQPIVTLPMEAGEVVQDT